MMGRGELDGRVAIVTGGSRGIGAGIARRFVDHGGKVVITSRKPDPLEALAAELGPAAVAIPAHVGEPGAARRCVDAAIERWGRLDILVNNAAVNPHAGPMDVVTRGQFDKIMEVNLWAPIEWTNVAVGAGLGDHDGCVINIVSNTTLMYGVPVGTYSTSKAALVHMTRQLAVELGRQHVRVNAIAPGVVDTDMARGLTSQGAALYGGWPIPRFGQPDDVAGVALFLAGPAASWMTGQVLVIDGGASLLSAEVTLDGAATP